MTGVEVRDGSSALAAVFTKHLGGARQAQRSVDQAAQFAIIDADGNLVPDRWTGNPFPPFGADPQAVCYRWVEQFDPLYESEEALTGVVITGTPVAHRHPGRPLAPGDNVVIQWVQGVPVVTHRLGS